MPAIEMRPAPGTFGTVDTATTAVAGNESARHPLPTYVPSQDPCNRVRFADEERLCLWAYGVVYNADVRPYAVFTSIKLPVDFVPKHRVNKGQKRKPKRVVDSEIYARLDGEVYACREPDYNVSLPGTADKVQVDEPNCDDIISYIATGSPALAAVSIKAKQACYLP
ncbi:hypothetical protein EsH8_XIV_000001 [Colletotrichum jinshuiense]